MIDIKCTIKTKSQTFSFVYCDLEEEIIKPIHYKKAIEHLQKSHPQIPTSSIKS